jgi:3-methyl-2-oxobutanoate hydroxymethyltransferase
MTTIHDLATWKREGRKFAMLTAYDFPTAQILDEAGIPVMLVGDSVANNILGYQNTLPVTMDEMLHHARAVSRGAEDALLVGDMPFLSYQTGREDAVRNAGRFLKEAGMHAVKLEGSHLDLTEALVSSGIPVMGHLGLTPQAVHAMGGYRVQAREDEAAERLLADAQGLEKSGIFSLVLEGIPSQVARRVTETVSVPTIGIGAGPHCDGQVLVITDLLGLGGGRYPKFVKTYANLREEIGRAARAFSDEVQMGTFPDEDHSYS